MYQRRQRKISEMNETGAMPEDFYNFSGLRHLSQRGIEILEYYTTFPCIPVELQQFFKRTIDYYSMRKQKDGELDLYTDLPYYLRPWDDLEEDEPQSSSSTQSATNGQGSRPEDNDFPGYDPGASACAGASTPLHDPFDRDSPSSPMFEAPPSPAMHPNGYDNPSSSPIYRGVEEVLEDSHNGEEVEHLPTGSIAMTGNGTFYSPFVIEDDPSPPEIAAPPAEVEETKGVGILERSPSPTSTSSEQEAAGRSQQHSSDEAESEPTASGSADPATSAPSFGIFTGIQEFLHAEANLTLILPVAPPSPTDLQIDESAESSTEENGDEGSAKSDEHPNANDPDTMESTPATPSAIDDPASDEPVIDGKEEALKDQTETPATSKTVESTVGEEETVDPTVETGGEEIREESKDKEEPPKKKRRFSWNESSEATETAAAESSSAGAASTTPPSASTAPPTVDKQQDNSSSSPALPPPPTPPTIPRSAVEKPKSNTAVAAIKSPQEAASSSTRAAPPAVPPTVVAKQDNSSSSFALPPPPTPPTIPRTAVEKPKSNTAMAANKNAAVASSSTRAAATAVPATVEAKQVNSCPPSDPPTIPTPPPIPRSTVEQPKPNHSVETNRNPQNAQSAHQPQQPHHHQRQPQAPPPTNRQIPVYTRPPFHAEQGPPFYPMSGPFTQPPPNVMGGGFPFNMHGAPMQQMGGQFYQQNGPPPGANPWNSQWVPLSTWSPPNGPPQCPPIVRGPFFGASGPPPAHSMMNGPPPGFPGQPGHFCNFCDSMQPHVSEDCIRYATYESRKARARDMSLCPHCLGKHNPRTCPAQQMCPRCGIHNSHVAFCLYRQ